MSNIPACRQAGNNEQGMLNVEVKAFSVPCLFGYNVYGNVHMPESLLQSPFSA
jgi:hypothetical protein